MKSILVCLSLALLMFVLYMCKKEYLTVAEKQEVKQETTYEYVDLGLSVKWATCNIGASKPEDYGDYYSWGEISTKDEDDYVNWSKYKFCKDGDKHKLTKYCNDSDYGYNGFTDNKTTLDMSDDVAHVKWGGSWRMPTITEFKELIENCVRTRTTLNGVKGFKLTSRKPGYTDRSIFLPAAGYHLVGGVNYAGSEAWIWSSSLDTTDPSRAWYQRFMANSYPINHPRGYGLSVRPVCP